MTLQQQADAIIHRAARSIVEPNTSIGLYLTDDYIGYYDGTSWWPLRIITRPLVSICGWCPGAKERTRALVDGGNDVSHGMCPRCVIRNGGDLSTRALMEQERL